MRILYRFLLFIVKITFGLVYPVRQIGRENIPEGAAVVCGVHSSAADPLFVLLAMDLPEMPCFMAKKELMKVPVLGPFIKAFNVFGVDRGHGDAAAVEHAVSLLENGQKIVLFPQGTRVHPGQFVRAKCGAVRMALEAEAPVLPVYVPEKKRLFRKNLLIIGEPFRLSGSTDMSHEEMTAMAQDIVELTFALGEKSGQQRLSAAPEGT